ncbi:MAG: hypothetical protein AAGK14_01235 [Verrucomicrobiota bacterium]
MQISRFARRALFAVLVASLGAPALQAAKQKVAEQIPFEDFEPAEYFVPTAPICDLLEVSIEPKQPEFPFGVQPQFSVTLRNISKQPINLAGHLESNVVFSPHMRMGYYRGDEIEISENVAFDVPAGHEILAPGATLKTDFPSSKYLARTKFTYRKKPDALLPGRYKAYLNFWVLSKGENTRAISPAVEFTITSDGSPDVAITHDIQEANSLPEGFAFELRNGPDHTVNLYGVNKSTKDVYLGNDWRWWRRYPGKAATVDREIPRLTQRVKVAAGTSKLLAREKIMGASFKGTYQIRFQYYNGKGKLIARSNLVKDRL